MPFIIQCIFNIHGAAQFYGFGGKSELQPVSEPRSASGIQELSGCSPSEASRSRTSSTALNVLIRFWLATIPTLHLSSHRCRPLSRQQTPLGSERRPRGQRSDVYSIVVATYSHMLHPSYCSDVVDVRHHILHSSVPGRVVVCEEVGEEVDHDNATLLSHHL